MVKGFITLTCVFDPKKPKSVYIKASSIEAVCRVEERGIPHHTIVQIPSHPNGGWKVGETIEEVFELMRNVHD